ncbi:hypothetical protein JL475_30795 [Streptomyces sp. M2CJ-2]|nr:hypothetical protein [Streptomyces sp. M2CJ-2]
MENINQAIIADIHAEHKGNPKEELIRAGATVGFMESVRYHALETDKEDLSWPAKWGYHGFGGVANFIPVVGDAVQRGVDSAAYAWQLEEQGRIEDELRIDNQTNFASRVKYLEGLSQEWARVNPDHELAVEDDNRLLLEAIGNSAFNANDTANRVAGDTPK